MKLFYNLSHLRAKSRTGIAYYTQHLIQGMITLDEDIIAGIWHKELVFNQNLLVYLTNNDINKAIGYQWLPLLRALPGAYTLRAAIQNKINKTINRQLAQENFIYHETGFIPLHYTGKLIITVHDLSHIYYPHYHPAQRVAYLNRYLPKAIQQADKIIVGSEHTRQAVLSHFNLAEGKINTIWHGVDDCFKPRSAAEVRPILNLYHLHYRCYILSVATLEPRKNLVRLLKAFSKLSKEVRQQYPLVLVGGMGWKEQDILALAKPLLESRSLILTGYVPEKILWSLCSGAYLFVYLSLYEGFGLPIIEAMASETAVLTSNVNALAEIGGQAAITVDPYSVDAILAALSQLLANPVFCNQMAQKGKIRAANFSWQNCIAQTKKVYLSIS